MTQPNDPVRILHLIQHLTTAIVNRQLFFPDHPTVASQLEKTLQDINLLTRNGQDLSLTRIGSTLVVNGVAYKGKHPSITRFLDLLKAKNLDHIILSCGVAQNELGSFIDAIASSTVERIQVSRHISFGKLALPQGEEGMELSPGHGQDPHEGPDPNACVSDTVPGNVLYLDPLENPMPSPSADQDQQRRTDLERIRDVVEQLKTGARQGTLNKLERAVTAFIRGFSRSLQPLSYLGSVKSFDEYTFVHMVNVFILTTAQADHFGFRGRQLYDIGVASILHDVGKLFIDGAIINKPGFLTDEERAIMQTHSARGARYLMGVSGLSKLAILSAMDHHIRFDGTGYPLIPGWKPNIISQMITIADAFDAMRSRRPYQGPKPQEVVISILKKESGTAFNPMLVDRFIRLLDERPASA